MSTDTLQKLIVYGSVTITIGLFVATIMLRGK
jgi:hypothetical protein